MTRPRPLPLIALFAALALAPMLSASIAELATFDEKVENAAAIVLGTCVKSDARWDEQHRWILTYSTFRVEKVLKGAPSLGDLTVVTPGGSVGDMHQETIGIPTFKVGDERVLFVKNTKSGPTVLYFDQGTYNVRSERGEKVIAPADTKLVTIDAKTGAAVSGSEPARTLNTFKGEVDRVLRDMEERRQKMGALPPGRPRQEASIFDIFKRSELWIALAVIGLAFAAWQYTRR
jgi:hypothetical protein